MTTIDAEDVHYRALNEKINAVIADGEKEVVLDNVMGHRYIGTGLQNPVHITINGTAGADLAALMNGADITVNGNAQAAMANTMNAGKIVVHGSAGDIMGYSQRGGKVFIRDNVGYRAGIHMKAYQEKMPEVVVGGTADDYLGEYMAGGIMVVLGIGHDGVAPVNEYVGTGMHGGTIYIRGELEPWQTGAEVGLPDMEDDDWERLQPLIAEFCNEFGEDENQFAPDQFTKLIPVTARPYGRLYAY